MTQADSVHSTPPTNTSADTTLELPVESAGALYVPTDKFPRANLPGDRAIPQEARDEIDRLMRFLDATDDHMQIDPDLEETGDDEPSLGGDRHDRLCKRSRCA